MPTNEQGARTYVRVYAPAAGAADPMLSMPTEDLSHRFEGSLSDFLTPGLMLKRCFDVLVAALVLTLCLPVMGLIALAIRWSSRGPAFQNVFRTGMGFRMFKVYTFRTTRAGADRMVDNLNQLTGPGAMADQLVSSQTRLGRMLRATGLDVLPMFYNVLLGDLSLVGVRPLPVQEASKLVSDTCCGRFEVPAGIWGPWGRNDRQGMSRADLVEQELNYVRNRRFLTDLRMAFGWAAMGRS